MTTTTPETFARTFPVDFARAVEFAMTVDARVYDYLSHGVDYSAHRCYLSTDGLSGFAISPDGDLQSVFNVSTESRGDALVTAAVTAGARTLDCFDGYLPAFYRRHGFFVLRREANWTPGEPDVVFMALATLPVPDPATRVEMPPPVEYR